MNYRLEFPAGGIMKEKVYPIDREVGCLKKAHLS
jgi:hypothetical protein